MPTPGAPARLQIQLLGEPVFTFDGAPWRMVAPPKVLPLLALLAVRRQPMLRRVLASLLWPDDTEADARANLRRHLHALSKALPTVERSPWILSDTETIAWNHESASSIDVLDFLEAVEANDPGRAMERYRGEFVAGNFDETVLVERERLRTLYIELLIEFADRALSLRDYAAARSAGEAMLGLDEWREDALRTVMHARYASGDRSGALATYERFANRLHTELRTTPTRETLELRDAIASGTALLDEETESRVLAPSTPIVGRDELLEELTSYWQRAVRGQGFAVFVAGDAGIGKTRLAQELLAHAQQHGGRGVTGRTANPESSNYQPIAEVLRALAPAFRREEHDEWLVALHSLVPELRGPFARLDDNELVPELRLQEAVTRFIERCARLRPIVIVLEDLHLARPATIELAAALAARVRALPVLLLMTYRTSAATRNGPLRALRRTLQRSGEATQIELPPLTLAQIEELLARQANPAGEALAERVFANSGGNPLFAWQLIHASNERADAAHAGLDISNAVLERLKVLDRQTRAVTDVAATIGDTFTIEEIAEVGGWTESTAVAAACELLSRQFISERAGIGFEYGFTHAAIASAIYDATPSDARVARHRRAAEVLSLTRAEHGFDQALVAEHWLRANDLSRARHWFLMAAQSAHDAHARADALLFATRVLQLDPTDRERFDALLAIVRSSSRIHTREEGLRALGELHECAARLSSEHELQAFAAAARFSSEFGDRNAQVAAVEALAARAAENGHDGWRARATLELGTLALQRGEAARAEACLRAIDLPSLPDTSARVHYYATLAQVLFRQTRFDEGEATLAELQRYLDVLPGVDGELAMADARTIAAWVMESPAKLRAAATRLVSLAQARGDLLNEARGRGYLAYVKNQLHDTCGARSEYERIIEIYERADHVQNVLITRTNYAMVEFAAGHIERAERQWRLVEEQASSAQRAPETLTLAVSMNIGAIELQRGNVAAALERGAFVYEAASRSGEAWLLANAAGFYGEALCAASEFNRGAALLADSIARSTEMGRSAVEPRTGYLEALIAAGRVDELPETCATLAGEFERDPLDQLYPARTCWALARAASLLHDEAGREHWLARGRELIAERLEAFADADDRDAYARSPFNLGFRSGNECAYA